MGVSGWLPAGAMLTDLSDGDQGQAGAQKLPGSRGESPLQWTGKEHDLLVTHPCGSRLLSHNSTSLTDSRWQGSDISMHRHH